MMIPGRVLISTYNIIFEYDTKRNNHKQRNVQVKAANKIEAEYSFSKWVEECNKEKPFKAYSNVKILECEEIDRQVISV